MKCSSDRGYVRKRDIDNMCRKCASNAGNLSLRGVRPHNFGKQTPLEVRIKVSATKQGISVDSFKGFITSINEKERMLNKMKLLKVECFVRDNYTCNICNERGKKLNAHHLNGWTSHPNDRYKLDNLITLCEECHKAYHKVCGKGRKDDPNTKEQFLKYKRHIDEQKD